MFTTTSLVICAEKIGDHQYSIWCTDEAGTFLSLKQWQQYAFIWHTSSFYGTDLRVSDNCILLSPWQAVEFFGKQPVNSLLNISFSSDLAYTLQTAELIFQLVQTGNFMPDYSSWQKGKLGWKPKDNTVKEIDLPWFSAAVSDLLERSAGAKRAWDQLVETYPLLTSFEGHFLDEQDWLEKIGWRLNDRPFQIGFRLNEPEQDGGIWKMEMFLRDQTDKNSLLLYKGKSSLPAKWRKYTDTIEREQQRLTAIVPWLAFENGEALLSEQEAWRFLFEASETFIKSGIEILLPSWWQAVKQSSLALKAHVNTVPKGRSFVGMNSLIDFNWRIATNGVELTEEEFEQLVEQKRRLVNIRGKWIMLDPSMIEQMKKMLKRAEKEGLHIFDILEQEFGRNREEGDELERPFAGIEIKLNSTLKKMVKQLGELSEIPSVSMPKHFAGTLRPYQKQGLDWLLFLRRFGFGACLADDMGLGKTVQMIAYFQYVKEREKPETPALIIVPTSVLGNWQKEIEKFAPQLNVYLHYGQNRKKGEAFQKKVLGSDIVLTSYGLSHVDFDELSSVHWSSLCIDEAQNIKNAHTKQSRSIRKLNSHQRIALTGTPIENRLTELWAIFDFINKGLLGSLHQFQKQYVLPIEKGEKPDKIQKLRSMIRPFLLRRTKRDEHVALNLPEKQEQKEYVPLTVEQASLYEQLVKDTFEEVMKADGFERKALILKMLGKLKQICNHPALYFKEEASSPLQGRSHKIDKLLELVEAILDQDESCLIFTQYIQMGKMLQNLLEKTFKIDVLFLHGGLSKTERDKLVETFQNGGSRLFILSLKAGGTGLNLTAANHVIHFDRWWNPAVENQATDRAYRIGQKRFVHVHKLITTGTIEEKIDDMIEKKQALNEELIQSDNWITELSTEELKDLIALRNEERR